MEVFSIWLLLPNITPLMPHLPIHYMNKLQCNDSSAQKSDSFSLDVFDAHKLCLCLFRELRGVLSADE